MGKNAENARSYYDQIRALDEIYFAINEKYEGIDPIAAVEPWDKAKRFVEIEAYCFVLVALSQKTRELRRKWTEQTDLIYAEQKAEIEREMNK